mgnify:CR=1 FL=1
MYVKNILNLKPNRMKNFLERFSVTKLVLLLIILTLMFIEIWKVVNWGENSDLFSNVVIAIVSFYFWQKGIEYEKPDSIVEEDFNSENKEQWTSD